MKTHLTKSAVLSMLVLFLVVPMRAQQPELAIQTGHSGSVFSLAFSSDGRKLISGSRDGRIKLWDVATGHELRTLTGHTDYVTSVGFNADGRTIASRSKDNTIRLWDGATGRELHTFAANFGGVAFTRDGKILAGPSEGVIKLWDVATGRELRVFTGQNEDSRSLAFSADGRILASGGGGEPHTIQMWDVATGRELHMLIGHSRSINSLAFSPDGKTLASGSDDYTIKLWEVATGRELWSFAGHTYGTRSIAFSADGKTLASGGDDSTIKLWDLGTRSERQTLTLSNTVLSVAFSPDGKTLAGGLWDNTIRLWEAATGRELRTLSGNAYPVYSVAYSADGKMFATGSEDKAVKLWDVPTGREFRRLTGHTDWVLTVAFSEDGKTLASAGRDKAIKLWDVATGGEVNTLTGHTGWIISVRFSPDGKILASGSSDKTIGLWEVATGRQLLTLSGHSGLVTAVVFSADGQTLASSSYDGKIKLWQPATGKELLTLTPSGRSSYVNALVFSPDGKMLVSGGADQTVKVWEVATGSLLRTLNENPAAITSLTFSHDGRAFASGDRERNIKIWEAATGREVRTLTGHTWGINSMGFSPDGKFLLSGSQDATTRFWRVDSGDVLATLISFTNGGWAVVTSDGRFDTNSLEEISNLHWLFPDDPFKALPPEIFMRQYYEPRLLPRLLEDKSFSAVPLLASLNRVQPEVKITGVSPATNSPAFVNVTIDVASANGEQNRYGKRVTLNSGVHDLRLFRDGQLVGYVPGKLPLDSTGKATINRAVKLPRRGELNDIEFTAYALNSDQVKSATSNYTYKPAQALPPVKGRAYIISVGVNAYEDPSWRLSFAARDARASEATLTRSLTAAGGYEVVPLTLTSDYDRRDAVGVTEKLATKQNFQTVLKVLAAGPEKIGPELLKRVPGAAKLRKAEPEDLVLINFSSHGYTDKQGKFYLIPYDTGAEIKLTGDGTQISAESLSRFISSDELSEWVRDIDAGEIVMIVDTCHSAGAVDEPGFKPGPMGSRGMGQLAYDKGMRILAASQADDVALELDRLKHGLLTYALIEEGLNQQRADKNSDGRIMLDEWLSYGAERVPLLYDDVKAGKLELKTRDARITTILTGASVKKNAFQQPQLFDFKRKRREIRLQ